MELEQQKDSLRKGFEMFEMQEELELRKWVEYIVKWRLKPLCRYEASCTSCEKRIIYDDLDIDEIIYVLNDAGWQLRDEGPHCANCVERGIS